MSRNFFNEKIPDEAGLTVRDFLGLLNSLFSGYENKKIEELRIVAKDGDFDRKFQAILHD